MKQGEIWELYLNPTKGSEQSGRRPAVIISGDMLNKYLQVVIVCPLTTSIKNYKGNVIIKPEYNYLSPFKNGICIYKRGDYYGLINSDEEVVVKGNFYDVLDLNKKFKGEFLYQLIF